MPAALESASLRRKAGAGLGVATLYLVNPGFWWDFAGKVGPPIFAGTLVACLLAGRLAPLHGVLMGVGVALIAASHWHDRRRS